MTDRTIPRFERPSQFDTDDPLSSVAPGETVREMAKVELSVYEIAHERFSGLDREVSNVELESAEVHGGDGDECVALELSADAKRVKMPDYESLGPVSNTQTGSDRSLFDGTPQFLIGLGITLIMTGIVGNAVSQRIFKSVTINGDSLGGGPPIWPAVFLVGLMALLVHFGLNYWIAKVQAGGEPR